jgi:hypothetical protein
MPDPRLCALTDEQWLKVNAQLPGGIDDPTVRGAIERARDNFSLDTAIQTASATGLAERNRRLADAARVVLGEISPASSEYRFLDDDLDRSRANRKRRRFVSDLSFLIERLEKVERLQNRNIVPNRRGPKQNLSRLRLIEQLLLIWIKTGQHLATSTSSLDGKASGPLVRFLCAATTGILEPPLTPDAARQLVRDIGAERRKGPLARMVELLEQ